MVTSPDASERTRPISSAGSAVLAWVVTFILTTIAGHLSLEKGTVSVSRPMQLESFRVAVVTVENYSKDFLQNVVVEVPAAVPTESIRSENAVQIVEKSNGPQGGVRYLEINQIAPRMVTRIFVPMSESDANTQIRVVNHEAAGLTLNKNDQLQLPMFRVLVSAAILATVQAAILFGIFLLFDRWRKELLARTDALKSQLGAADRGRERIEEDLKVLQQKTEAKLVRVEGTLVKQRVLLFARIADYSRELDFWRNVIRRLLVANGAKLLDTDVVIRNVTNELGTHGTKEDGRDFDAIVIAARWLKDAENEVAAGKMKDHQ